MADPFGNSPVSNSSFLNNGLPNWQEFVKYYNANKGIVNHPLGNHPTAIRYDRVLPNDQYLDNMPWQYTPQMGRQFSYWEYPQRVARYYDMIRAASPDWKPPEWLDVNKVNEAYDYMKLRNEGRPTQEWKALPEDDPGVQLLQGMGRPPVQYLMPSEITYSDLVQSQAQVDAQKPIDWSEFDEPGKRWMKLYLTMFSPQSEGITGRPEGSKLFASVGQALLPSLGVGAALGAVTANPLVGAIGVVASTALLTYQNYTGNQIPGLNAIMRPFNYMAEATESTIGNIALGSEYGLKEVFDDPEAAYRAGLLNYETMKMSNIPNWFAKTADLVNPMDVTTADKDEIWKISSGILEPVKAPHGKGAEALKYYHDWIQTGKAQDEYNTAINEGNFTGRYQDYIYQKAMSEYGDTAIANDMVFQTVLDPLNVLPWAVGKTGGAVAGKIAKTAKDPATIRQAAMWSEVLKEGTGNIMIDALPIGLQQLVSGITKKSQSRGVMDNLNVYRDHIRNYTFPKSLMDADANLRVKYESLTKQGVKDIKHLDDTLIWKDKNGVEQVFKGEPSIKFEVPKIEDLSSLEKFIGGIDETYGLKELRPTLGKKFLTKFASLTPDSQTAHILTAFHHNIATMMDAAGKDPARMVDLINKLSGKVQVKPGELGFDMINSPANKAVMAAMQYAFKDGDIAGNELGRWLSGGERRSILEKVAGALNEKVADVLTQLQDNPDAMAARLNKIAPELNTTGKDLTTTLKVFTGEDAMPWNAEQFQANLVNAISVKMDDFFKEKYGLTQDSWVFKASNALKGVQSLVLLGFNPAYFMNNWVNNVVTRAADGIGGYMTNKQVNEFYTRFGIFPKDSGLGMYDDITGSVIRNAQTASKDVLSKAQKTITYLNKAGVFSRLSNKIEKLEGGQARVIAMNQYLDKTKKVGQGIRKLDIATEIMLDNRYPGLKERIYNAVNAGMNMKEIEESLFSTEIRPQIENIIDEIEVKYPNARDTLRKLNLTDRLRDELANVKTQEDIDIAFENVRGGWEDWVNEQTSRAIINSAEKEAFNKTVSEGMVGALQTFGNMVTERAKRWLNGRKEWDDLYGRHDQMTDVEWDLAVKKLNKKQRADWERTRNFEVVTHNGIIQALGIESEHSRAYVNGIEDNNVLWNGYWKENGKLYDEYFSGKRRGKDENYEDWRARNNRAYNEMLDKQDELYARTIEAEKDIQRKLDANFVAMYEKVSGWDGTPAAEYRFRLWNRVSDAQSEQIAMRKRTRGMTIEERSAAYRDWNPGYNKLIADMHQFEHDGAYKLMKKPVPQNKVEVPQPTSPIDAETSGVQGALRDETAKLGFNDEQLDRLYPRQAAEAVNQARRQAEQAKNPVIEKAKTLVKAKITAEDIYNQADQAKRQAIIHDNGMLARADVQDGFIEAFPMAERGQVTVAMTMIDQFIDTWAKRNGLVPSEAVRDAWYATRIGSIERGDGTVGKGALEKLDQLMTEERINTPEFKRWFGDSKVVDDDGNPLVVYHGTPNGGFTEFDLSLRGTRSTGKVDDSRALHFTDNYDATTAYSEAYLNDTQDMEYSINGVKKVRKATGEIKRPNAMTYKVYLSMQNPLHLEFSKQITADAITKAKADGYDGIITDMGNGKEYVVFKPEQIKSVFNQGTFDPNNPNILKQGETAKGSYKLMDDGRAIIRGMQSGDISTMVHEVSHVFRRDLSDADMDIVAQHGGLVNGTELRELEAAFMRGELVQGTPEYAKYVAAEEQFARGWERYLAEGDAPTPQLKGIFRQFTDLMLNIYKSLRKVANKLTGVESTPLNVDITAKVNGQSLKDVFDRMLTDKVDRIPTYDSLVSNKFTEVKQTGRNHRFSDADLTTMAHKELIADILGRYDSEDAARKALTDMQEYEYLKDGTQIDDSTISDALKYVADHPEVNPWNKVKTPEARAVKKTLAYGVRNHEKKYGMTFKVVSLDDLIASDNIQGANLVANANFPQDVQGRITTTGAGEVSNRMSWIIDTAGKLQPDELLYDSRSTQIGSPIVGGDNVVASGNGRVAVLQYARENFPDKWAEYQNALPGNASQWGIKPEDIANIKDPVLVRELDADIDLVDFANDANKPTVAVMTTTELALNDANNITPIMLKKLNVLENEDIYQSLQQPRNNRFVNAFMETLTSNERSGLTSENLINQQGIERVVNALIAKVYNTADGEMMLDTFRNSTDNNIKTLQSAIMASLPQMAFIEGLIKNGERAATLSLADDIAFAANKISSLRDQGMGAGEFLGQMGLFGEGEAANLTPSQRVLLTLFDAKAPKKIREALREYAQLVERQPAIGQDTTANLVRTKEDLLNDATNRTGQPAGEQGSIFGQRPDAGTAETVQGNELARPETAGEVQPAPGTEQGIPGVVEQVQGEAGKTASKEWLNGKYYELSPSDDVLIPLLESAKKNQDMAEIQLVADYPLITENAALWIINNAEIGNPTHEGHVRRIFDYGKNISRRVFDAARKKFDDEYMGDIINDAEKRLQPAVKQPWEMTRAEFHQANPAKLADWLQQRTDIARLRAKNRPDLVEDVKVLAKNNVTARQFAEGLSKEDLAKLGGVDGAMTFYRQVRYDLGLDFNAQQNQGGMTMTMNVSPMEDTHYAAIVNALAEGKPVPPEVLRDYPDLVAKQVISTETKADYDAGKAIPIEKAAEIDIAHQDTLPIPDDVSKIIDSTDTLKFDKKQQAQDYVQWALDGEKGPRPNVSQDVLTFFEPKLDRLREWAAMKSRGIDINTKIDNAIDAFEGKARVGSGYIAPEKVEKVAGKVDGYVAEFPQVKRAKILSTLNKETTINGKNLTTRARFIENSVDAGDVIKIMGGERSLVSKDGTYMPESEITKTAMDYAEFLLSQKARGVTTAETVKQPWEIRQEDYGWKEGNVELGQTERGIRMEINKWQKILDQMLADDSDNTGGIENVRGAIAKANTKLELTTKHRKAVEKAVSEGKAVPHEVLLSYPDLQAKVEGYPVNTDRMTGIGIQKVYAFKHGDTDIVANVYKDGELIAYMPAVPLKDAQLEDGVRILGLDPQFPDKWVYEQDGVIKSVDSRKPEVEQAVSRIVETGIDLNKVYEASNGKQYKIAEEPKSEIIQAYEPQTLYRLYEKAENGRVFGKTTLTMASRDGIINAMQKIISSEGAKIVNEFVPKVKPEARAYKYNHEMTLAEYSQKRFDKESKSMPGIKREGSDYWAREEHKKFVERALKEGKEVSPNVLNDYPELKPDTTAIAGQSSLFQGGKPSLDEWLDTTPNYATFEGMGTAESISDATTYSDLTYRQLFDLKQNAPDTLVSAKFWSAGKGGVGRRKIKVGKLEFPDNPMDLYNKEFGNQLYQSGQLDMFSDTNTDLPLFSGTPMSADDMGFAPKAASPQISMFPDIVPEAKPTRIIEIAIKEKGSTAYIRIDLKKTKAIKDTLALHKGADMTARILDANGKVVESNLDPQNVVSPKMGGNALFQAADNIDTPEFKNWFSWDWKNNKPGNKPSVIVDGNGNPLLVHHGSPHDFNEFDFSNVRENGTSEGVGFYYIDNEDIARGYAKNSSGNGFLYDGYLSITNPMTLTQKKITKSQWKQIIKEIEKTYPEALANYGDYDYYGREKVLNDAINIEFENNDTDLDIIGSFGNGGMADWETINRAVVKVTGYDGVVTEWNNKTTKATVYVTFLPEQFKSTNNSGEYNPRNPNFLKQEGFQEAPGATEQFREYNEPPIDVQRDMDAPMGHVPLNGTPTTEPFAQTLNEIGSDYINPILTDIQSAYKAKMGDKAFSWGDVADADRKTVRQYLNGTVTNDLADVKRAALTYGDTMRNNAMLDYGRRYGFDNYLNLIFPYQFWYTRSMMNWAKRAIDKPSWFAMYARLQQAQERMERDGMPTRLKGKTRFNQAWMPEWMGGGLWTDPMQKIFPFDQFGQPFEQYSNNQNQINKRAESIIDEMRTSEKISSAEAQEALDTMAGSAWERAVSQAEIELDKSASPLSLATMMMTPALWWTIPYNIAQGTPEKISPLPITRTGQTMKELGRDTFFEPMTDLVGGIMAGGETAIRKKAGLSEFGQWGDYYIDRTLAGMAADGEITTEEARIAMIQRNGDAFAEAYRRTQTEQALRTPGAAGLMALKETVKNKEGIGTVAGQTLSGFLVGMFGGGLFSEGELKMRGLKPEYDNAWRKFDAGDEEALNNFFDNHPEYYARLALYDEPETRLHQFLVDSIWKKYMDLDVENRRLAREALGDEFMNSFMNKETRSYDAISDETLARWSQTLGKSEMPEQVKNVQGGQIEYYDQPMVQAITTYKAEKERQFPNIYVTQEQYFALPAGAQRKAFLNQNPKLKAYWDWKDAYAEQHPEIVPYFDELKNKATADEVTSEMTNPLIRALLTYATGGSLTSGAKSEIERVRQMYAPDMDEDEFLMLLMQLVAP